MKGERYGCTPWRPTTFLTFSSAPPLLPAALLTPSPLSNFFFLDTSPSRDSVIMKDLRRQWELKLIESGALALGVEVDPNSQKYASRTADPVASIDGLTLLFLYSLSLSLSLSF